MSVLCVRGCVRVDGTPHEATHGNYCTRCYTRIAVALTLAPTLEHHILAHMVTGTSGGGDRVQETREPPVPFNVAAFDDANELFTMLTYWVGVWGGVLGRDHHVTPLNGWRTETGKIVGLPAGTTPIEGARQVGVLAAWLRNRLDQILTTTLTDDLDAFDAAIRGVWRMDARWPRVEKPRVSQMPCPMDDCGRRLMVTPPAMPGGDRVVSCDGGGHWYTEDEYDELIVAARESATRAKSEARRSERVVAKLWKKYGTEWAGK